MKKIFKFLNFLPELKFNNNKNKKKLLKLFFEKMYSKKSIITSPGIKEDKPELSFPRVCDISVNKVMVTITLDFLKSLKLDEYTETELKAFAKQIGPFVYFFEVNNAKTGETWK